MGFYAYLSRDRLKSELGDSATTDDTVYRDVLEAVSEAIDNWLGRTFRVHTATRVYTPVDQDVLWLPDDLLAVTTLKTDPDDDQDYDDTWSASTDYALYPYNASVERKPYYRIDRKPNAAYSFPLTLQGAQIVGKWGFWEELETLASLANEAMDATETGFDVDSGADFDVLDTILVDSEQMYVTAIATNTLTVIRGVNGTTAASHLDDAVIKRYRYPGPAARACGIQAARILRRKDAPFGVIGSVDVGFTRLTARLDPDVLALLDAYKVQHYG